jgi:hypothetical protein
MGKRAAACIVGPCEERLWSAQKPCGRTACGGRSLVRVVMRIGEEAQCDQRVTAQRHRSGHLSSRQVGNSPAG